MSKTLSLWLRRRPGEADLLLTPSGWAEVEEVLSALKRKGLEVGRDDQAGLVARCDKQRFELSTDGVRIRARQGHTLPIQGGRRRVRHIACILEPWTVCWSRSSVAACFRWPVITSTFRRTRKQLAASAAAGEPPWFFRSEPASWRPAAKAFI